ncbi:MAG: hypothetical protein KJ995_08225 [Candidatus Omnitrophica bacterium]|nr:hypothetical protein [Candidatus Omnitrophota bacterium]MBU1657400.1 hypothetical protein [Candidatus Omnitrophota bacterium]MBU1785288.1 hypothetical protein [Candidatus Omnitrophota bacterium]MBU1852373.1 hypothetical protein [Candidatus Omnitrophota bacterium]
MDVQTLLIIAAAIHLVIRLLKTGSLGKRIPARYRPIIAVVLGGVAAAVDTYARGVPWQQALAQGMLGAATAMGTHDAVIEGLLGGNEILGGKKNADDQGPGDAAADESGKS